jgi:hypothetical protein
MEDKQVDTVVETAIAAAGKRPLQGDMEICRYCCFIECGLKVDKKIISYYFYAQNLIS